MKTILKILFLIFLSTQAFAQLSVDAGKDTILCAEWRSSSNTLLGGNPTATGGVGPYTYKWSSNVKNANKYEIASYLLDDTTIANPKLLHRGSLLKLKLLVTDANGVEKKDSVTIQFSQFIIVTTDINYYIKKGEQVKINSDLSGGVRPNHYTWSPNYNISDIHAENPMVWPDVTTVYKVSITDAGECVSFNDGHCTVYVGITGTKSAYENDRTSNIFPNPIENNSILNLTSVITNNATIVIYNTLGEVLLKESISSNNFSIGDKISKSGLYFYTVSNDSEILTSGQFIK